MKRRTFIAAMYSCVFFGLLASSKPAEASGSFWWHYTLTQAGRNANILRVAQSYPNGYKFTDNGGECKEWVRRVVLTASQGLITIPSNNGNAAWSYDGNVGQYYPQYPAPGDIIQMQWNGINGITPHTMIVVSCDGQGMNVIDCNWYSKSAYSCVYRHSITWTDFRAKATAFSVYYIK
jgi:hypothetical protein